MSHLFHEVKCFQKLKLEQKLMTECGTLHMNEMT